MPEFVHRHAEHAVGFHCRSDIAALALRLTTDLLRLAQRTVAGRIETEGVTGVPTTEQIHDVVE